MLLETKARLILFTGRMFKMSEYRNFTETELTTFERYIEGWSWADRNASYIWLPHFFAIHIAQYWCSTVISTQQTSVVGNEIFCGCSLWKHKRFHSFALLQLQFNYNSLYSFFPHSRDFFQIRICVYPYKFGLAARRGRRDDLCLNCHNWLSQKNSRMEKMKDSKVESFFSVSVFMYRISCDV